MRSTAIVLSLVLCLPAAADQSAAIASEVVLAFPSAMTDGSQLGVSETGDPTGVWRRYPIPSYGFFGGTSSYLALTDDTVVIAMDLIDSVISFPNHEATLILTVEKSALYALPDAPRFKLFVPLAEDRFLVHVPGESAVEYVFDGTHGPLLLNRLDTIAQPPILVPLPMDWSLPGFNGGQRGGPNTAVEKNGWIWFARSQSILPFFRRAIIWGRFHPETREMETGIIDDPTGNTRYENPSLAVNKTGVMVLAFSMNDAAAYVVRDAAGSVSAPIVIRAGDATPFDIRVLGKYTSTVVDPIDDSVFWTLQPIAKDGGWETVWAKIETASLRRRTVRK